MDLSEGTPVVFAPNVTVGLFHNIQPYLYFSGEGATIQSACETDSPAPNFEWSFSFGNGSLGTDVLQNEFYILPYFVGAPANLLSLIVTPNPAPAVNLAAGQSQSILFTINSIDSVAVGVAIAATTNAAITRQETRPVNIDLRKLLNATTSGRNWLTPAVASTNAPGSVNVTVDVQPRRHAGYADAVHARAVIAGFQNSNRRRIWICRAVSLNGPKSGNALLVSTLPYKATPKPGTP